VICCLPHSFPEIYGLPPFSIVGAKDKFFYIVNVNFSKIVGFKGTIRTFLNVVAAHTEDPFAYWTHFFRVNVPSEQFF
jgi:hypothetical protein